MATPMRMCHLVTLMPTLEADQVLPGHPKASEVTDTVMTWVMVMLMSPQRQQHLYKQLAR